MKRVVISVGRKLSRVSLLLLVVAASSQLQFAWADDDAELSSAKFSAEAAAIFNRRCTACHTYGKGIKVGPDLKGVTERRKRDWLLKFIHSSSSVIKSGDLTAVALFAQFKQQRMPDWSDLSEKQINDILDFVAVGGPDIKPADERNAELATPADIERGRQLFTGQTHFKYGAQACNACHTVQGLGFGGSLGPNLTQTYLRYQDKALTQFLRNPCFQWNNSASTSAYLTTRESFAVKAFLRQASLLQTAGIANTGQQSNSAELRAAPDKATQGTLPSRGDAQKGPAR
ncbi:MAG: cytochrome c [Candidatus Angelobacter sp.]